MLCCKARKFVVFSKKFWQIKSLVKFLTRCIAIDYNWKFKFFDEWSSIYQNFSTIHYYYAMYRC